jgi:hypothetical protein
MRPASFSRSFVFIPPLSFRSWSVLAIYLRPSLSARTAWAIAIAIRQSSCAPFAAPVLPLAAVTNVRHSASRRLD